MDKSWRASPRNLLRVHIQDLYFGRIGCSFSDSLPSCHLVTILIHKSYLSSSTWPDAFTPSLLLLCPLHHHLQPPCRWHRFKSHMYSFHSAVTYPHSALRLWKTREKIPDGPQEGALRIVTDESRSWHHEITTLRSGNIMIEC